MRVQDFTELDGYLEDNSLRYTMKFIIDRSRTEQNILYLRPEQYEPLTLKRKVFLRELSVQITNNLGQRLISKLDTQYYFNRTDGKIFYTPDGNVTHSVPRVFDGTYDDSEIIISDPVTDNITGYTGSTPEVLPPKVHAPATPGAPITDTRDYEQNMQLFDNTAWYIDNQTDAVMIMLRQDMQLQLTQQDYGFSWAFQLTGAVGSLSAAGAHHIPVQINNQQYYINYLNGNSTKSFYVLLRAVGDDLYFVPKSDPNFVNKV